MMRWLKLQKPMFTWPLCAQIFNGILSFKIPTRRKNRIAFIAWNPFQLAYFLPLLSTIPGAVLILEVRKSYSPWFNPKSYGLASGRVLLVKQKNMAKLDQYFDTIVCQTIFKKIYKIKRAKIIMIQYGYAKSAYNFGEWRALADLTLTFGKVASQPISQYSPVNEVGNIKYDKYISDDGKVIKCSIAECVILYAPTWGDLSSIDEYLDRIFNLAEKYTIWIKPHHNSIIFEKNRLERIKKNRNIVLFDETTDLLTLINHAMVVITDYSGAIFDAIFLEKPVLLLNISAALSSSKICRDSIEIIYRKQLGLEIFNANMLKEAVEELLADPKYWIDNAKKIRRELFRLNNGATKRAKEQIIKLREKNYNPKHLQYRKTVRDKLAKLDAPA